MDEMDVVDDFAGKSNSFLDWLRATGTTISPKIELADLRSKNAGRAVLAKEDITDDEELFSIPRSSVLTVETSGLPAEITSKLQDPWLGLITAMIYEYQLGSESAWKAYFDVLPSEFDTLMFWSDEELKHLQGSAVADKVGKICANEAFSEQVIPILKQHQNAFHISGLSDGQLQALCHRMGSTIMAYAFDLEKPGADVIVDPEEWEEDEESEVLPKGMVPLADMLNADADRNNAKLYYEDDQVVMKSICPIKIGEEIFNDYGPLPTADVLRRYGYVTDNYSKYDVVELDIDLIRDASRQQLDADSEEIDGRIRYLEEQDVLDTAYDISRPENVNPDSQQFPEELVILLETLVAPRDEFEKLAKKEKLPKPNLSPAAAKLLREVLQSRSSMYSESVQRPPRIQGIARRWRMARTVIAGEKQVIQEAIDTLRQMVPDVDKSTNAGAQKRKADLEVANGTLGKKRKG